MWGVMAIAAAATIAGSQLAGVVDSQDGKPLELVSCGVRHTLWIEHYAAGLYVRSGTQVRSVRDPQEAKAVRLHMIDTRYLPKQIPKKWRTALERELEPDAMARVNRAYSSLSNGDEVTISYAPRGGIELRVNERVLARAPGHGVIDSILSEWAQGDPLEQRLARLARDHPCPRNPVALGEPGLTR